LRYLNDRLEYHSDIRNYGLAWSRIRSEAEADQSADLAKVRGNIRQCEDRIAEIREAIPGLRARERELEAELLAP
jgi:hypothetical protein